MVKNTKKSSAEPAGRFSLNLVCSHLGLQPITVCTNDDHLDDLDLFYGKVNFGKIGFYLGKGRNNGYFGNYCSLIYESC